MKQRYFCSLLLGLMTLGAFAQTEYTVLEDLTSKIQNANFSEGTPVDATIRTYDYDIPDQKGAGNGGEGYYGQQQVPGWIAATPSDNTYMPNPGHTDGTNARAAGLFAYNEGDTGIGLGGNYFAPMKEDGLQGYALGLVAVWSAEMQYSQEGITLPEGGYMLIFKMFNAAGNGTLAKNLFGFKSSTASYMSSKTTYQTINEWFEDTVFVRLKEEAELTLTMGLAVGNYGSNTAPHLFVDNVRLLKIDPQPLDQAEIDARKEDLLKTIEDGEELGADTSEAQAVYDNPKATMADVEAAITAQLALNEAKKVDLSDFFISNAHFLSDTPIPDDNGITTYDYDMPDPKGNNGRAVDYFGMQPVSGWVASHPTDNELVGSGRGDAPINAHASGVFAIGSNSFLGGKGYLPPTIMSDGSSEGNVLGFVGVWSRASQYTQDVTIPAGKYTLTISYYNAGGTGSIAKNLMGFIEENGTEHLSDLTSFEVGKWGQMVISFELDDETNGKFSMGYTAANLGSGSMPHFFIDGISLVYKGELVIDPSLFALQAVVNQANNLLSNAPDFYETLKTDFEDEISKGEGLVSSHSDDKEANIAATERIQTLMTQVRENIQAYADLHTFYDGALFKASEKYTTGELGTKISTLSSNVDKALSDLDWSTEDIRTAIASLPVIIKEGVQALWDAAVASGEKLEADLDITPLFEQMAYTYSTSVQQGANVPDKEWSYGSASNFKTQYGTAEVWSQSPFTVSRTLSEMPAGRYTITTKAFYRTAANDANLANYDSENPNNLAFVFAGNARTPLTNVAELVSSESADGWTDAGSSQYVPNGQLAAYNIFEDAAYDELLSKSATTALVDGGDLTFGVTAEQMESDCWTIWYSFSISYNAVDAKDASKELMSLVETVQDYINAADEELSFLLVTKAKNDLNDAIAAAEDAEIPEGAEIKEGDLEKVKKAMTNLLAAWDYAKKADALIAEFNQACTDYAAIRDDYKESGLHGDFWPFDEHFDELVDMPETVSSYKDNDEVQGYIDELPVALVNYAMSQDMSEASEDNPVEITLAILNYDFEAGNTNHWTITGSGDDEKIGQNQGYQDASYTNEAEGITVSHFLEAWRKDAILHDGDITQTLLAPLPEGYYMLEADGWSTNQAGVPEGGIQGAYLYAGNGTEVWKTPIGITETAGTPYTFAVKFYSDGTSDTNIGLLVENTNANWIAADNFRLFYIGEEAPDAVEGVKDAAQGRIQSIYSVSGARQSKLVRGLNIVKTTDGARKVLVK